MKSSIHIKKYVKGHICGIMAQITRIAVSKVRIEPEEESDDRK